MIVPGKYDQQCESLMINTNANACIVVVAGGRQGDGFSVCFKPEYIGLMVTMPQALRDLADSVEKDINLLTKTNVKQ